MTAALIEPEAPIVTAPQSEAVKFIDGFIRDISFQTMVSQNQCLDFALDLRLLLTKENQGQT